MRKMTINLIGLFALLLALFSASMLAIEKWDLIKRTWGKFKTLFTIYILWSKEDRIRASEISKKYKLPGGCGLVKNVKVVNTFRRRRH